MAVRVLVCGGRDFNDEAGLARALDAFHAKHTISVVIEGEAQGADILAREWAKSRKVPFEPFPANWNANGKAAGPIRNAQMLKEGKPDVVIAFPGGSGTADMVKKAFVGGVKVVHARPTAPTS
jgi:hypothetical protein